MILFCLKIDLMNRFIFSEFTGVFPSNHDYMATILQLLKFQFLSLIISFFIPDCCSYVFGVNVHFH